MQCRCWEGKSCNDAFVSNCYESGTKANSNVLWVHCQPIDPKYISFCFGVWYAVYIGQHGIKIKKSKHLKGQLGRLEICQKIYTTRFSGQKFYTLKVRKLRLFFTKNKQRKFINISYFSCFFVGIWIWMLDCVKF